MATSHNKTLNSCHWGSEAYENAFCAPSLERAPNVFQLSRKCSTLCRKSSHDARTKCQRRHATPGSRKDDLLRAIGALSSHEPNRRRWNGTRLSWCGYATRTRGCDKDLAGKV